jgi:hypothetical protein
MKYIPPTLPIPQAIQLISPEPPSGLRGVSNPNDIKEINIIDLDFIPSGFLDLKNILSKKELNLLLNSNNINFIKKQQNLNEPLQETHPDFPDDEYKQDKISRVVSWSHQYIYICSDNSIHEEHELLPLYGHTSLRNLSMSSIDARHIPQRMEDPNESAENDERIKEVHTKSLSSQILHPLVTGPIASTLRIPMVHNPTEDYFPVHNPPVGFQTPNPYPSKKSSTGKSLPENSWTLVLGKKK